MQPADCRAKCPASLLRQQILGSPVSKRQPSQLRAADGQVLLAHVAGRTVDASLAVDCQAPSTDCSMTRLVI